MSSDARRLYRSSTNRVLAGVCGGLGEYLHVDPVVLRVAWVAAVLLGGFGILLYIIWIFIVPLGPSSTGEAPAKKNGGHIVGAVFGALLMLVGVLLLLDQWFWIDLEDIWEWSWRYMGPVLLIGIGVYFLFGTSRTESASEQTQTEEPAANGPRKLRKSQHDRKMFGVCGGLAEYFDVDATLVRLLFVGVTLAAPPIGIFGYIAFAILTPAPAIAAPPTGQGV